MVTAELSPVAYSCMQRRRGGLYRSRPGAVTDKDSTAAAVMTYRYVYCCANAQQYFAVCVDSSSIFVRKSNDAVLPNENDRGESNLNRVQQHTRQRAV